MRTHMGTAIVATIANPGLGQTLSAIVVAALILLLVLHEILMAASPRLQRCSRFLRIAIVPLLLVFTLIAVRRLRTLL